MKLFRLFDVTGIEARLDRMAHIQRERHDAVMAALHALAGDAKERKELQEILTRLRVEREALESVAERRAAKDAPNMK